MNLGLVRKALRETWLATLLFGLGLAIFEGLIAFVLPLYWEEMAGSVFKLPFVRQLVSALLGAELGENVGLATFGSIAWVHPIVLALLWTHETLLTTRVPAAEIDAGTIDLVLGWPVTRWELFISETVVWMSSGAALIACAVFGHLVVTWSAGGEVLVTPSSLAWIAIHLYLLYLAVGAFGALVSSLSSRRGQAVGWIFAALLISFTLQFVAQFWAPARSVAFLGVLDHYRPLEIIQTGRPQPAALAVLGGGAILFWTAAGVLFSRRAITTV